MDQQMTVFDDHEHEYRVGGWLGTIEVMSFVGNTYRDRWVNPKTTSAFALEVCKIIAKNPQGLPPKVRSWSKDIVNNEQRFEALQKLDMVEDTKLKLDFSDALHLQVDAEYLSILESQTSFGRLTPMIGELAGHYSQQFITRNESLTDPLKLTHRDIEYFLGHYDPSRQ